MIRYIANNQILMHIVVIMLHFNGYKFNVYKFKTFLLSLERLK